MAAALLAAACAAGPREHAAAQYLEEATGTTITRAGTALVLASEEPSLAANARDYAHVAPLTVNIGGRRAHWLWLSLWSTIDRGAAGEVFEPTAVTAVQLILDDEPMDLDLTSRAEAIPGVDHIPYETPVPSARSMVLPLTASQLARICRARSAALRIESDGRSRVWTAWSGGPAQLSGFAALAVATPPARAATAAHER